jgi:hypothetical protein
MLIRAVEASSDPGTRLWLLTALSGSDTPAVRAFWLGHLRAGADRRSEESDAALWFAFLRAFLDGWLEYTDFRRCVSDGHVFAAAGSNGDYPTAIARLKLDTHGRFSKWHRQVIYDIAHQPDVSLSYGAAGWIRDFPGEDYLWDALDVLGNRPDSWWHLSLLRWASGVDADDRGTQARLAEAHPIALMLLSLLRPDLSATVGQAFHAQHHKDAVTWLKTASPDRPLDLRWIDSSLRPWAQSVGQSMIVAVGVLCSVDPPQDFPGSEHPLLRRREFIRRLLPEFDRLMDNLLCLHALRKEHFEAICRGARSGRPNAIRSLALWSEKAHESLPLLFRLTREGSKPARRAARESLEILQARSQVADLADFERLLDLATAWSDAGLEGRPARIWWDICGYRLKLSVAAGKVALDTYSGPRRLASLPSAVRAHPEYQEVKAARAELARSYRYFRHRFEVALVEGVCWRGRDFATLLANPIVRSLVSRLVLLVDGRAYMWILDDPLSDCHAPAEIASAEHVAVAHPLDLIRLGVLAEWQQQTIDTRTSQPFKQVFRECYLVGEREGLSESSRRFEGHALVARRAFALLRSRGYSPRSGEAVKEWPQHDLLAHICWAAEAENAGRLLASGDIVESVTSGPVWFSPSADQALRLSNVHPLVFSETLRDADLLVSRAAAGDLGFTSEETLRLRATLVRYLVRALGLTTVYVSPDSRHALVDGSRAMYRVHLGSGSVFLEESRRHLDVGAVSSQRTQDLIAESLDTLTARILGLIAALAQDHQITDAGFLSQLPA